MEAIINKEVINQVANNQNLKEMKNLNLLFVEGNRTKIENSNVVESYNKIKAWGFIETMPIEYFPMDEIKDKLGKRQLYKPSIKRKKGEGVAVVSNFDIEMIEVPIEEYDNYDGICGDGQHRTIALMFDELKDITATYQAIKLPKEDMDILAYISIRNNGKKWVNEDFYASGILTGDNNTDYILSKRKEGYIPAFLFNVYTLGTSNLTSTQIKSIQQGYKKLSDFSKVQISKDTQEKGDRILKGLKANSFMAKDRLTGRFGAGLKAFFTECKDMDLIINTINLINKDIWEEKFSPVAGQSVEAKFYKEALLYLSKQVNKTTVAQATNVVTKTTDEETEDIPYVEAEEVETTIFGLVKPM